MFSTLDVSGIFWDLTFVEYWNDSQDNRLVVISVINGIFTAGHQDALKGVRF